MSPFPAIPQRGTIVSPETKADEADKPENTTGDPKKSKRRSRRIVPTEDAGKKRDERGSKPPSKKADPPPVQTIFVPSDSHLLRRIHPDPKWIALRVRIVDLFVRRIRQASNATDRKKAEFPLQALLDHLGSDQGQKQFSENMRLLACQLIEALRAEMDVNDPVQFHRRFIDVDGMPVTT